MDNQRHVQILKELDKKGSVSVNDLCLLTGASESSIRRDLVELDRKGFLKRVHGGAILISKTTSTNEDPLTKRQQLHLEEKRKIAKYSAKLIEAGDVVYIDAGSSTLELIEYLDKKEAHYITNGLVQAQQLTLKGFHVVSLGGEVRNITGACVGSTTLLALQRYHFTKGFFGTNGLTRKSGCTTPDANEAAVKAAAMEQCRECYVLCDSSKFDNISSVTFADFYRSTIITDKIPSGYEDCANIIEVQKEQK